MSITSIVSRRNRRAAGPDGTAGPDRIEVLLKREAPGLLAYFTRRVRPTEDAADLLSETMVIAWRRSAVLPLDDQQARMWLYGVARNLLSTHRRGQIRRETLAAELRNELATQPRSTGEDTRFNGPRIEQLQQLVSELPQVDREIVSLVVWDELTLTEVATLLNMPAGTVRSRYSRARASLRSQLEADHTTST